MLNRDIKESIIYALAFIIAVVCHEYAHAYSAYKLGDPSAKNAGRLTLNPLAHVDPLGLLSMIVFKFGWAKGVPVNPNNFRNYRRDNFLVSFAGIFTNMLISILAAIIFRFTPNNTYYLNNFLFILAAVNIMLGIFNLVPIPPLDGSKMLMSFLPYKIVNYMYKYEFVFYILLIILVASGKLQTVIWRPIMFIMKYLFY